MGEENRLSGHTVYRTEYRLVWIPTYWRKILNPGVKEYFERIWPKILKEMAGVEIVEQDIQVDHIHSIMIIPPKFSVSKVIGRLKCESASKLRRKTIGMIALFVAPTRMDTFCRIISTCRK